MGNQKTPTIQAKGRNQEARAAFLKERRRVEPDATRGGRIQRNEERKRRRQGTGQRIKRMLQVWQGRAHCKGLAYKKEGP